MQDSQNNVLQLRRRSFATPASKGELGSINSISARRSKLSTDLATLSNIHTRSLGGR
jgi:hypothetical protein